MSQSHTMLVAKRCKIHVLTLFSVSLQPAISTPYYYKYYILFYWFYLLLWLILIYFFLMHWLGSKIIRTSEDSTSRSEDSDGSTPQLTTDFPEDTTGRLDGCDGSASQLTSRLHSCVNNTAGNAKKPIRGPPDLNKVVPSMADIKTITKPSKDADHPVNVQVAEDSDEEGNFCC